MHADNQKKEARAEVISPYLFSRRKRFLDVSVVIGSVILGWPILLVLMVLVWLTVGWPVIFKQERVGIWGRQFVMYKFRTMQLGAELRQSQYLDKNEVDGPVFKIRHDPRFVGWGKWLAWSALDELPQLLNVLRGDMSLVGPRPLPVNEWQKLPKEYQRRSGIKPGITSLWIVEGAHELTFREWMKRDDIYLYQASLGMDLEIILKTILIAVRFFVGLILGLDRGR